MGMNDDREKLEVAIAENIIADEANKLLTGRLQRIQNAITSGQPDAVKLQVIGLILKEDEHQLQGDDHR